MNEQERIAMTNALDAPRQLTFAGFSATRTGLVPNDALTAEQWDAAGEALAHVDARLNWYTGDWVLSVREKWEQGTLEDICNRFGLNYSTVANCSSVCRAVEFSRRRENLSFGHHAEVANRTDADELLDWAESNKASVQQLRAEKRCRDHAKRMEEFGDDVELPTGKYAVIYADPPWRYEHAISNTRKIENQYPTMNWMRSAPSKSPLLTIASCSCGQRHPNSMRR